MPFRKKSTGVVLILVVLFILFSGARIKRENMVKHHAEQISDMASYATYGSFMVGNRGLVTDGEKPLEINVWYPALNPDNLEERISYGYVIKMADPLGMVTFASYQGRAIREAEFDLSPGPYPLVILSPGFSFGSTTYAWLAEHLASYGFVVMAPEHSEHLDPANELWKSTITRPQDVLDVIAYVDEQVESGSVFGQLVDRNMVAVIGHSFGGYTALAAAGAHIHTEGFKSHCEEASASNHPAAWLCDELLPHLDEMAALAGLTSAPEGLWPAWADSRVDAIVPMAGDAFFFGQDGLAEITIPVMAIGGTNDNDAPYLWGTYPAYEYASSLRKVRISLTGAEHMIFTGPCEETPLYLKPFSGEFCSDPGWDRNYAHHLVSHFTTAFLLAELKQDPVAAAALAPESVEFPNVTYEAQGYAATRGKPNIAR